MVDVLIIDDDELFLELIRDFLSTEACTLRAFSHAEDALASLQHQLPDVLILDLMLPKYGGVSVYHALRATSDTMRLPVIISTAAPQHVAKMRHFADDMYACVLPKPYHLTTLLAHIHEMADAHQNARSTR